MKSKFQFSLFSYIIFFLGHFSINAQNQIKSLDGYSSHIGTTIAMLDDLKSRVTNSVANLDQQETDFLLDAKANRIGALILHLAATEKHYQVYTFENRAYNDEEKEMWDVAMNLGDVAREELQGKPISYYLGIWDDVRKETKRLLKYKDDEWFFATVSDGGMNNYWAWYHVMEHQANHMGQIRLIIGRME